MKNELAVPRPGSFDAAELKVEALALVAALDDDHEIDELVGAWEELRPWDAHLKELGRQGKDTTPMLSAIRWAEVRIGDELPHDARLSDTATSLSHPQRTQFRRLSAYRDAVKVELAKAVEKKNPKLASRRHLLKILDELNPVDATLPDVGDESGDGWEMLFGDMRERLFDLPDESVDLIFTDPPYPKKYLPLYRDLAEHAARLLKPRGFLVTYAGVIFLPEVFDHLKREELSYGWTFSLLLDEGSQSRIMGRHVIQGWKPLIVASKGQWTSGEWMNDPIRHARQKDKYGWQQDAAVAAAVIERFSRPNGVVLDPFMGSGTTGEAAVAVGRQVIGVEADDNRFSLSVKRLIG